MLLKFIHGIPSDHQRLNLPCCNRNKRKSEETSMYYFIAKYFGPRNILSEDLHFTRLTLYQFTVSSE